MFEANNSSEGKKEVRVSEGKKKTSIFETNATE